MTSSTHNAPPAVAHADLLDFGGSAPPPATAASELAAGGSTGDLLGDLLGSETGSGVTSPPPAMPNEAAFAGEDQSNLLGDFMGSDAPSTTATAGHDDSFLLNFGDDNRPAPAAPSWQPSTGGLDDIFGSVEPSQSDEPPSSSSGGYDMSDMGFAMPTAPPPAAEKPANSLNQGVRQKRRKGGRQGLCRRLSHGFCTLFGSRFFL